MYLRARFGYENALGLEYTSSIESLQGLGILYKEQGKLEEAGKMFKRALAGYGKALGSDHISRS